MGVLDELCQRVLFHGGTEDQSHEQAPLVGVSIVAKRISAKVTLGDIEQVSEREVEAG